ncbi:aquaporin [Crenobacter cavernae]|nr:MIP/aquaporin family protein [Crenobacter cavernae]
MKTMQTRKLAAEALGTALLLAVVVGSGVMGEKLAAGNVAIALLANALATAGGLYVLITLFGPISGAHFNPAVTLAAWLSGEKGTGETAAYVIAQVAGAVAGVWAAHAMFDLPLLQFSQHVRSGGAQWWAEGVATFGLLLTIGLGVRHARERVAALVACYILAAYWFTASTSFANPAVTLARALTDTFAGIRPADVGGFVLSQLAGALAGWATVRWLLAGGQQEQGLAEVRRGG